MLGAFVQKAAEMVVAQIVAASKGVQVVTGPRLHKRAALRSPRQVGLVRMPQGSVQITL